MTYLCVLLMTILTMDVGYSGEDNPYQSLVASSQGNIGVPSAEVVIPVDSPQDQENPSERSLILPCFEYKDSTIVGFNSQVVGIQETYMNVIKILDSISFLKNLGTLNLGHNYLSELPQEIGELVSLHTLQLKNNLLKALPESLKNLRKLQLLNLDNNKLTHLPGWIILPKLAKLRYVGNGLTAEQVDDAVFAANGQMTTPDDDQDAKEIRRINPSSREELVSWKNTSLNLKTKLVNWLS